MLAVGSNSKTTLTMAERLEIWKASKQSSKADDSKIRRINENLSNDKGLDTSGSDLNNSKRLKKTVLAPTCDSKAPALDHVTDKQNSHPNVTVHESLKIDASNAEISRLSLLLAEVSESNEQLQIRLEEKTIKLDEALLNIKNLEISSGELSNKSKMAQEEIFAYMFENSVQAQKIEELEQAISKDRIETSEAIADKVRKHKDELRKLATERAEYENRANYMIREVNDQMAMLQQMAMQRIEELEKELMSETTKSRRLEEELVLAKSASTASRVLTPPRSELVSRCSTNVPSTGGKVQRSRGRGRSGTTIAKSAYDDDYDDGFEDLCWQEDGDVDVDVDGSLNDADDSTVTECNEDTNTDIAGNDCDDDDDEC